MAKPLEDRQRAALSNTARLADVEAVIADTHQAIEAAKDDVTEQKARALDLSVSAADATKARIAAGDAELRRDRHAAALTALDKKRGALAAGEQDALRIANYRAAKVERDELAAAFATIGAPALEALVDLLKRATEQSRTLAAVNQSLPKDEPALIDAECIARGFAPNGVWLHNGIGEHVFRLADIRLPHFSRRGFAWPDEDGHAAAQAEIYQRQLEAARHQREQREAREASRRWYTVERTDTKMGQVSFQHANGIFRLGLQVWPCELYADQVETAEAAGMVVTPIDPPAEATAA